MTADALPVLLPVTLLCFAVVAALVGAWRPVAARAVAVVGSALGLGLAVAGLAIALRDGNLRSEIGGWAPPLGIEYVLDPLSGFVAVVVMAIGLLIVAYPPEAGFGEAPRRDVPLYSLTLLVLTGLLGVTMSADLFNLFVFLEIYSIASYALVSLGGDRAVLAAFRYLIFGTIASGLYLLGVGFVYFTTGTLNMADAAERLPVLAGSPTIAGAVVLIVVGVAIKAALFPLHVWLPEAHSNATPAVAALLAAVQVKVGAYVLIRILFGVFGPGAAGVDLPVTTVLAWFSAAGIVVGSVWALRQSDLKRLLAYSTVAQLGFIGLGIGLATPLALSAALLHVLNHAVMKACLFLVAGGILLRTGLKQIPRFAGLGRRMPWLLAGFTIAALSMIGIPPTAGFFSKWYLLLATVELAHWPFAIVIVGSSLLTAAYFLRIFEQLYTAEPTEEVVADATDPPLGVVAPVLVLAAAVLVIGFGNVALLDHVLTPISQGLLGAG